MARERDTRLDVLKALAIALVILGHAITLVYAGATHAPAWLAAAFTVIAATNVPLFMFVSGYLARRGADARWVGGRALRLLVPFAAWSVLVWLVFFRGAGSLWLPRMFVYPYDNGLWFLYVLFELCVLYALLGWNRWLLVAGAAACLLVEPDVRVLGIGLVASQFPVFVSGRLFSERKFEPGPWVIAVAAVLLIALWTRPGENPMYAIPAWSVVASHALGTASWLVNPVMVVVRLLRLALELSLVASCFWIVRRVRHGAWLGAITLGMYASHQFFVPRWLEGSGQTFDVLVVFAVATAGAAGTALLLERWSTTRFLLLGSGMLPEWTRRGRVEAP